MGRIATFFRREVALRLRKHPNDAFRANPRRGTRKRRRKARSPGAWAVSRRRSHDCENGKERPGFRAKAQLGQVKHGSSQHLLERCFIRHSAPFFLRREAAPGAGSVSRHPPGGRRRRSHRAASRDRPVPEPRPAVRDASSQMRVPPIAEQCDTCDETAPFQARTVTTRCMTA
jgi:hypothetical protein